MAVTAKIYGKFLLSLANKEVDLDSDSLYVMLVDNTYTPNQDTHQYLSSVVADEISATGYTANGQALVSVSVSYDGASNTLTFNADDPSWTSSSITARYAVFYDRTPASDATRPLICYWDFGTDETSSSGTFTLQLNASGIVTATVS